MQLKERAAPALVDVTHAAKAARGPCHTHGARMCWCKLPTVECAVGRVPG